MVRRIWLALLVLCLSSSLFISVAEARDLENTLYLELKDGRVVIEMLPDVAPNHVARIKELARDKFYDGIVFHRVIQGFMAQTGDPTGTGRGGSDLPDLKDELSDMPHVRGALSMAHAGPNTGNSQFFILFAQASHLDGVHTVWGRVIDGMQYVDNIKKGSPLHEGIVSKPDKIISLRVAADVEENSASEEAPTEPAGE